MHASSAAEGSSSIRQMNVGPSCASSAVVNPAAWRASKPLVSVASQPRSMLPPQAVKSTATITPIVVLQSPMGSAAAGVAAATTIMIPPAVAPATEKATTVSHVIPRRPTRLIGRWRRCPSPRSVVC